MGSKTDPSASETYEPMPVFFGARLSLAYGMWFLFVGLFLPYFPLWLKSRELSAFEISAVLTIPLIIRVFASSQVMVFADKQNDRAVLYSWLYGLAAVAILLYLPASSFWVILAVTFLFNLFSNPLPPLLDAITLSGVRRFDADYGKIRIWGSIVFIIANMGGGALLVGGNPDFILYALIVSIIAGALLSVSIPRIGRKQPYMYSAEEDAFRKSLIRNSRFLLVLSAAGLAQASHALIYGFGSIYWQSIGIGGTMIGLFWAIGVVAEIILFQFSKPLLTRFTSVGLIAIGCLGGVIRWILFPFVTDEYAFLVLQILHGFSFGAAHIGLMHYIMESVPEEHIGAGQGIGYVLGGVVMGAAVFGSGPLYDSFGADGFWAMAALCALGLVLIALKPKETF